MREQLTQNDVKKIEEEIEYRKLVVRKEAIEAVKEARAQGDLSENFEYYAAKRDKNKNESRIRYLERMLKTASIVEDHSQADEVGLNNLVTVYFEEEDETEQYKLVTSIRGIPWTIRSALNLLWERRYWGTRPATGCWSGSAIQQDTMWKSGKS